MSRIFTSRTKPTVESNVACRRARGAVGRPADATRRLDERHRPLGDDGHARHRHRQRGVGRNRSARLRARRPDSCRSADPRRPRGHVPRQEPSGPVHGPLHRRPRRRGLPSERHCRFGLGRAGNRGSPARPQHLGIDVGRGGCRHRRPLVRDVDLPADRRRPRLGRGPVQRLRGLPQASAATGRRAHWLHDARQRQRDRAKTSTCT